MAGSVSKQNIAELLNHGLVDGVTLDEAAIRIASTVGPALTLRIACNGSPIWELSNTIVVAAASSKFNSRLGWSLAGSVLHVPT